MRLGKLKGIIALYAISLSDPIGVCWTHSLLSEHIARKEGFFHKGTLPATHHNPGALVYTGQYGATSGEFGYAKFSTDEAGWVALDNDIAYKRKHHIPLKRAWAYLTKQ